jgi:S-adenosylmethionine:tRNA ribosyltransferase-isomerase
MDSELFNYDLPEELIAAYPVAERTHSRLMVINRKNQEISHNHFYDLPDFLPQNATLFRNNARVFKARLYGQRETGGKIECLLLHPEKEDHTKWWCMIKPGRKFKSGGRFIVSNDFYGDVIDKNEEGQLLIQWNTPNGSRVQDLADQYGEIPLPPYITAKRNETKDFDDSQHYQTVFAEKDKKVAAAAPTAGLHFTTHLLEKIKEMGIPSYDLTLHIGMGTFKPIQTNSIEEHPIHTETYQIEAETVAKLFSHKTHHVAVGTTSVRAIEHAMTHYHFSDSNYSDILADANIYIYPPYQFKGVDSLITNFHLPKSTLMCLVSAFLSPGNNTGIEWLQEIYKMAVCEKYRFYSYGDAMLIL